MLTAIDSLPPHVIGFTASGVISADDYRQTLMPAIEAALAARPGPKLRFLYHFGPKFERFSAGAAWQDAVLGMQHMSDFERIAVVTDSDAIQHAVRMFGFAMPGHVRVFAGDQLAEATDWISAEGSRLAHEFLPDEGILIVTPHARLEEGDFKALAQEVDPFIEEHGALAGLLIVADRIPGWESLAAFAEHVRFVRDHHRELRKVAVVSDARLLTLLPRLSSRFVKAEVRSFPASARAEALAWIREAAATDDEDDEADEIDEIDELDETDDETAS